MLFDEGGIGIMSSVKLFDFQKRILDNTTNKNKVAYYLDMG